MSKKGQFRYYLQVWDETAGDYTAIRSAASVALKLELDPVAFPPTSRTGASLIGEELRKRGAGYRSRRDLLYVDYCAEFWDWTTSPYVRGKQARGQRKGREYVDHNAAYVRNYLRPAFPALKLAAVKPFMLEDFILRIRREKGLSGASLNAILSAASIPLAEAARLGLIVTNPAENPETRVRHEGERHPDRGRDQEALRTR